MTIIKLTGAQFFNLSPTNLLTRVHWAKIQYYLGLSLEIVTLQLVPFVERTYALVSTTIHMVGSASHQTSPHQAESTNFHQQDDFLNLERERDREKYQEGRVHTTYTSGSRFRRGSHIFHG